VGVCRTALSTRSDARELRAYDGGPTTSVALLNAESGAAAWRIVELFSRIGQPFEVEMRWSSGSGSGAKALLTVAHAARVCVFARGLDIRAANLTEAKNPLGVTVADGFTFTRNQWEFRGGVTPSFIQDIPVPPFAESFRVELANLAAAPSTQVLLFDGTGGLRARFNAALQPPTGILLGGAGRVAVQSTDNSPLRAVFNLSL